MRIHFLIIILLLFGCSTTNNLRTPSSHLSCFNEISCFFDKEQYFGSVDPDFLNSKSLSEYEKKLGDDSLIEIHRKLANDEKSLNNKNILKLLESEPIPTDIKFKNSVTLAEAEKILALISQSGPVVNRKFYDPNNRIGFCFGKATIGHIEALLQKINPKSIKKIWRIGGFNGNHWSHHVAVMIRGDDRWYVLDPLMGKVLNAEAWTSTFGSNSSLTVVTRPERFGPLNSSGYTAIDLFNSESEQFCRDKDCYRGFFKDYFESLDTRFKSIEAEKKFNLKVAITPEEKALLNIQINNILKDRSNSELLISYLAGKSTSRAEIDRALIRQVLANDQILSNILNSESDQSLKLIEFICNDISSNDYVDSIINFAHNIKSEDILKNSNHKRLIEGLLKKSNISSEKKIILIQKLDSITEPWALDLLISFSKYPNQNPLSAKSIDLLLKIPITNQNNYLEKLLAQRNNYETIYKIAKYYILDKRITKSDPLFKIFMTQLLVNKDLGSTNEVLYLKMLEGMDDNWVIELLVSHAKINNRLPNAKISVDMLLKIPKEKWLPGLSMLLSQRNNVDTIYTLANFFILDNKVPKTDPLFKTFMTQLLVNKDLGSTNEVLYLKMLEGMDDNWVIEILVSHAKINNRLPNAKIAVDMLLKIPKEKWLPGLSILLSQRNNVEIVYTLANFFILDNKVAKTDPLFKTFMTQLLANKDLGSTNEVLYLKKLEGIKDEWAIQLLAGHAKLRTDSINHQVAREVLKNLDESCDAIIRKFLPN